jgi:hypothetical protein
VFLYHKLYLRPGATPPAQEPLPVFEVTGVLGVGGNGVGVTGECADLALVTALLGLGSTQWHLVWWRAACRADLLLCLPPALPRPVPGLPHVGLRHPLHSAHSPLIRALPDYEAQFSQQLGEARAFWEASQQRLHK